MKKKIVGSLFALAALVAVVAPSRPADAQVTYSDQCCDTANVIRCIVGNGMFPLGARCFCEGQGYGHIC